MLQFDAGLVELHFDDMTKTCNILWCKTVRIRLRAMGMNSGAHRPPRDAGEIGAVFALTKYQETEGVRFCACRAPDRSQLLIHFPQYYCDPCCSCGDTPTTMVGQRDVSEGLKGGIRR